MKQLYYIHVRATVLLMKMLKRKSILVLIGGFLLIVFFRWKFVCTNKEPLLHINSVVSLFDIDISNAISAGPPLLTWVKYQ